MSILTTLEAPDRKAASEWIPLPQPMSRKLFPDRSCTPRKSRRCLREISTRSSL